MAEMEHAGEDHGDAMFIGGRDDFGIAPRSTGHIAKAALASDDASLVQARLHRGLIASINKVKRHATNQPTPALSNRCSLCRSIGSRRSAMAK